MAEKFHVGDSAPPPPRPLSEAEILANRVNGLPTATILCVTYQAKEFVTDALAGILSQISPYPFRVIVRDDGSTDGTQEILRHYANQYPNTVELVLERTNTYQSIRPFSALSGHALGDFVLLCEGDDYWLDTRKIDKQISALLADPAAVVAFHNTLVVEDGRIVSTSRLSEKRQRNYSAEEILAGARMTADTLCFRNIGIPTSPHELQFTGWIKVIRTRLGEYGSGIFLPDVTHNVYRRHSASLTGQMSSAEDCISTATSNYWMAVTLAERGHAEAAHSHLRRAANQILSAEKHLGLELRTAHDEKPRLRLFLRRIFRRFINFR